MRFTAAFGPGFYGPDKPEMSRYSPWIGQPVNLTRKDGVSFTAVITEFIADDEYDTVYMTFDAEPGEPDSKSVHQLTEMVNRKEKT